MWLAATAIHVIRFINYTELWLLAKNKTSHCFFCLYQAAIFLNIVICSDGLDPFFSRASSIFFWKGQSHNSWKSARKKGHFLLLFSRATLLLQMLLVRHSGIPTKGTWALFLLAITLAQFDFWLEVSCSLNPRVALLVLGRPPLFVVNSSPTNPLHNATSFMASTLCTLTQ